VHCQVVLTQAEQTVQGTPAGSLKLSCVCSGFTLNDCTIDSSKSNAPGRRAAPISSASTQTMFPASLLLLAAVSCVISLDLTQPASMTVQPAQPMTISLRPSESWRVEKSSSHQYSFNTNHVHCIVAAAPSCVYCEELTQQASMTVQPGHPLIISCKPAGKALERIGSIYTRVTSYKNLLKNNFSLTLDSSNNIVFILMF
ncbi:unnamed protein product, partial [Coregonus sp. 'balchen']